MQMPSLKAAVSALALVSLLSACQSPMDFDLRGKIGGSVDTSQAALNATEKRPDPDNRGVISYPNYQVAVARRGDTVASVAARLGLPAEELARYNGVKPNDPLRRGELMALPNRVAEPSPATGADATGPIRPAGEVDVAALAGNAIDRADDTRPARQIDAPSGVEPTRHRVARGETAFTIARLYQVTPRSLAEWNGLDAKFSLREGQYLLIPTTKQAARPAPKIEATPLPGEGSPTPTPPSAATPLPQEATPPVGSKPEVSDKPVADIGQDQAAAPDAAMLMPVQGRIIRDYAKGRNEGIDIAASAGTTVKAAAAGKVASVSTTAEGVKFLLVRHADDLITVYTHLDGITVKKGDSISRGQTIGKVRKGDPAFLHFEVRKGFESTDPMPYLQ